LVYPLGKLSGVGLKFLLLSQTVLDLLVLRTSDPYFRPLFNKFKIIDNFKF
jgi:hypothetical protein